MSFRYVRIVVSLLPLFYSVFSAQQLVAEKWNEMVWYGMVWYGMVWYGMVWYGMVWYGMVWYGMELYFSYIAGVANS